MAAALVAAGIVLALYAGLRWLTDVASLVEAAEQREPTPWDDPRPASLAQISNVTHGER